MATFLYFNGTTPLKNVYGVKLDQFAAIGGIKLEPLYLYARKSTETEDGKLFMVRQSAPNPLGYELVTGEGLRINIPYDQYFNWIWQRARSAPIMCWGKQALQS